VAVLALGLSLAGCWHYDGHTTPPPEIWETPTDPVGMANAIMNRMITQSPYRDFQPRALNLAPLPVEQIAALSPVADELHRKLLQEPHIQIVRDPQAAYTLHLQLEPDASGARQLVATLTPAGSQEPAWSFPLPY